MTFHVSKGEFSFCGYFHLLLLLSKYMLNVDKIKVSAKVEKIYKESQDLIPSPSVKIQIIGGKAYLR